MRFLELRLTAFGPFTDCVLDLRPGREGLHIVYGPNEAGKSSALRAIRHLLYGIPMQTGDNFIHPYPKMRIGGVIVGNGKTLSFVRRKGKIRTLYDEDDRSPLDEQELANLLAGVDEDRFTGMFGIDHDNLVQGGREILEGGGELGRLIFTAGSGVAGLRDIQDELRAEAGALFKPSGQNPRINAALAGLKTLRKELREAELPVVRWAEQDRDLRDAEKRKAGREAELVEARGEFDRLQRIQNALPDISRRGDLTAKLENVADAVRIPPDFPEKRRDLRNRLRNAEKEKNQAATDLAKLQREIRTLEIPPGLMAKAEHVEQVHEDLGGYRKALKDRRDIETRLSALRGDARELLRGLRDDLTLEQADRLRVKKIEAAAIRELCTRYERLDGVMETTRAALPELERKMQALTADLEGLPPARPVVDLKLVIAEVEEFVSLEKQVREEQVGIDSLNRAVRNDLQRLGLAATVPDDLDRLAAPSRETVDGFEIRFGEADLALRDRNREFGDVQDALAENAREQDVLRTEQDTPTEEDLAAARRFRDSGWRIVSDRLAGAVCSQEAIQGFKQVIAGAPTLEAAYEQAVQAADDIADRLRREADRVSRLAALMAGARAFEHRLARVRSDLAKAEEDRRAIAGEWMAAWAPLNIPPGSPKEMMRWISDFQTLVDKAGQLRARIARSEAHAADIRSGRRKLRQSLQNHVSMTVEKGESLAGLIRQARNTVEAEEEHVRRRNQLTKEAASLEQERQAAAARLRDCQAEIERWRAQWKTAVRPLGLDESARPSQADVMLDGLRDLFDKIKDIGILEKRILGIDKDAHEFTRRVNELARVAAPDIEGKPPGEIAVELHGRLKQAFARSTRKKALEAQGGQEKMRLARSENDIREADVGLKMLCDEAGCNSAEELPRIEQRAADRREIETELANVDQRLRLLSAGAPVTEFVMEALKEDPDGLNARIESLDIAIQALSRETSEIDQAIGTARAELRRMNGDARAADIAETIQTVLGGLAGGVEHYARLRIADQVLGLAIERFREQNQGPILTAASRLFHRITLGAFSGARAEFDDSGRPVIVGERSSGESVNVRNMSDGSADQLYLALRLAGLQAYLDKNTPIPFIVDDILIRFDDERAVAALALLTDLSRITQVVFFTHHRRLVELAERHVDAGVLNSVCLGAKC